MLPDPTGAYHNDNVQVRALTKLCDIFYGKQVSHRASGTVKVKHAVTVQPNTALSARVAAMMSDEELEALDRRYLKLAAEPTRKEVADDAQFEELMPHVDDPNWPFEDDGDDQG